MFTFKGRYRAICSIIVCIIKHLAELINADADGFHHELRPVVAFQAGGVLFRVLLRQEEGLFRFSIVEIGYVDTAEVAIDTAARTHDPMAVARPRGITLGKAFAVEAGEVEGRRCLLGLVGVQVAIERYTDDVGIVVPDVKAAITTLRKEQIVSVEADAWQGDAFVFRGGIINEFLFTEMACRHVKRTAIEVVLHFLVGGADVIVIAAQLFGKRDRLAVKEVFAIGRPGGEHLQKVGVVADDAHRVGRHIIENQIAGRIKHLHFVGM